MRAQLLGCRVIGLFLVGLGSLIWSARFENRVEANLTALFGDSIETVDPQLTSNLSSECDVFNDRESWILFILDARQLSDGVPRTYFETTNQVRQALIVEQDPPILRLNLGLGLENPSSDIQIPIRVVRETSQLKVLIAITRWETRVLANSTSTSSPWPNITGVRWSCEHTRIGNGSTTLSEGFSCIGCEVKLRYVTGTNFDNLNRALDSLSNSDQSKQRGYVGTILGTIGLLLFVSPRVVHRGRD